MFGVNDTRWSAGDVPSKAAPFEAGLRQAIELTRAAGLPLVVLRESRFGHGREMGAWEGGLNEVLAELLAVQDRVAAECGVPVVDTHGAYVRAQQRAWARDPRYEFTPDVIHPTSAGHAAMAAELLRALGAGLPLSGPEARGPLSTVAGTNLVVEIEDGVGLVADSRGSAVPVTVRLRNRGAGVQRDELKLVLGRAVLARPVTDVDSPQREGGTGLHADRQARHGPGAHELRAAFTQPARHTLPLRLLSARGGGAARP